MSECNVRFFVDSGAGQCMCSCLEAFSAIKACAIIVVGVSGSLPIHGVDTALFLAVDSLGEKIVLRIHNCLLCTSTTDAETFNLISVSQLLSIKRSSVCFQSDHSTISLSHHRRKTKVILNLIPDEGLYALDVQPMSSQDEKQETQLSFDFTVNQDLLADHPSQTSEAYVATMPVSNEPTRSPTKGGVVYKDSVDREGHLFSGQRI
jgi:hypothetical protein